MKWPAYTVIGYGLLILIGGMIGYAKAHSAMSLIMGSASAALVLTGGWYMLKGHKWGHTLSTIVSALLLAFFCYRFAKTGSFMPAGMMAICSLAVLGILVRFRNQ